MTSKQLLNSCYKCKTIGREASWKVTHKNSKDVLYFKVLPSFFEDTLDLDTISKEVVAQKFNISEDEAEETILDGEACCPICNDLRFYIYDEKVDTPEKGFKFSDDI